MSSGVYKITCKGNNKIYIGSSIDILKRINSHSAALKSNRHINSHMQSSWNKYGPDSFKFEIIKMCNEEELLVIEQFWIDKLESYKRTIGFNRANTAGGGTGNSKRYIVTTPDGKEMDVFNLDRLCRKENLHSGAMHAVVQGKINHYKGWTARYFNQSKEDWKKSKKRGRKSGRGWKGDWLIKKKDGTITIVKSLWRYAKENKIHHGNMYDVINGKRKSVAGIILLKRIEPDKEGVS